MATAIEAQVGNPNRSKFVIAGLLILAAVIFLIASNTISQSQYFFTVEELFGRGTTVVGTPVRVAGAVIGDTIDYDPETLTLKFTVAHMPADDELLDIEGGLGAALTEAVNDPDRLRMDVIYIGVMPDLLQHEAQAIMTGQMGEDGIFHVEELLLKCPTRYEEAVPGQSESDS